VTGHVYILTNKAMPDLVKVGKTSGDTDVRATALSGATGVAVTNDLWDQYTAIMRAYGSKLRELLNIRWRGPEGFSGRWEISEGYSVWRQPK
jgi:hypothetical protein